MVYLLQVTLCWTVFYLLYALWLSRETFFRVNRWYLLSTLVLGLVIPLVEWQQFFITESHPIVVPLDNLYHNVQAIEYQTRQQTETTWLDVFWLIYQAGILLFTLRFAYGIWQIFQLYRAGTYTRQGNIHIIYTDTAHLPFSFFNLLFWSKQFQAKYNDQQQILRHEEAHISGWHTLDVLFMEVLGILFWCSPMIYLYRASMRNVHEYLADAWVLQTTTKKTYGRLLLQQSMSGFQIALANNFMNSQLKKRIIMMTRNHSPKQAIMKYLFLLPILVLAVLVFSKREHLPTINQAYAAASLNSDFATANDTTVHKVVEEMPRFPGCENLLTAERKDCAQQKMLEFIYTNIKYPKAARDAGHQGTAVLKFIVETDGSLSDFEIMRSPANGAFDGEVLRVANEMPNWIAGKQAGEAVRVRYMLPVKFKLEDDETAENTAESTATNQEPDLLNVVEEMPRFPGCEQMEGTTLEKTECAKQKLLEFIYTHIKYPQSGRDAGIQGTSVVRFVVEADGTITTPEMLRSIGDDFDETILEVVAQMPKWTPGKEKGVAVAVQYNLPVKFKLADEDASEMPKQEKANALVRTVDGKEYTFHIGHVDDLFALLNGHRFEAIDFNKDAKEGEYKFIVDLLDDTSLENVAISDLRNTLLKVDNWNLSPNPSSGKVVLSFEAEAVPTVVRIIDIQGRIIKEASYPNYNGYFKETFYLKESGYHFVQIVQGDKMRTDHIRIE